MYAESVLAGLVGPVTSCRTDVAPLSTGTVPWVLVIQRGKSRTEEAATPATEFAAFASEPVARFRPSELGGKFPRKLLQGPLAESEDPSDPAEPDDCAPPVAGASSDVDRSATGTVSRTEARVE